MGGEMQDVNVTICFARFRTIIKHLAATQPNLKARHGCVLAADAGLDQA